MGYLGRFTGSMLLMVTSSNRVQLYMGWELVGVASYRLISYWWTRRQAGKAGIKAMVVNRVGDWLLGLGIRVGYGGMGCMGYGGVWSMGGVGEASVRIRIGRGLLGGTIGKSAQLGLHTWLPDAMEGPTPVSALLHSATMVTAGVYRLVRISPRLESTEEVLECTRLVGGVTARYAGSVGLVQHDRKRVIAYSTCSQLGYMVAGVGISGYDGSRAHRANHALYKALLFRCSGSVIHGMGDEQDRRGIGGVKEGLPVTYGLMTVGSGALIGRPYRTGYYSKDALRERAYSKYSTTGHRVYRLLLVAGGCTTYYSRRRLSRCFMGKPLGKRHGYERIQEANEKIIIPMVRLGVGAVMAGWRGKDMVRGLGTGYWGQGIGSVIEEQALWVESENRGVRIKVVPARVVGVVGVRATEGYWWYREGRYGYKISSRTRYRYRSKKWYADKLSVELVGATVTHRGLRTFEEVDRGVLELTLVDGLVGMLDGLGQEQGNRENYMEGVVIGGVRRVRLRL